MAWAYSRHGSCSNNWRRRRLARRTSRRPRDREWKASPARTSATPTLRTASRCPVRSCSFPACTLNGVPAPIRRLVPERIELLSTKIDPAKAFDLELPLYQAAAGYRATDGRRAVETLLLP